MQLFLLKIDHCSWIPHLDNSREVASRIPLQGRDCPLAGRECSCTCSAPRSGWVMGNGYCMTSPRAIVLTMTLTHWRWQWHNDDDTMTMTQWRWRRLMTIKLMPALTTMPMRTDLGGWLVASRSQLAGAMSRNLNRDDDEGWQWWWKLWQ